MHDIESARRAHRRMAEVITSMKTGMKQGQQAQELALIIHGAHRPYSSGGRVACENHMDAREEEVDWPCDEVRKLAMVLGIDLVV